MDRSRDLKVLDIIVEHYAKAGQSPSYREIMQGAGLTSSGAVSVILNRLKCDGFIDWSAGKRRSITLLKAPVAVLCPHCRQSVMIPLDEGREVATIAPSAADRWTITDEGRAALSAAGVAV